MKLDHPPTIALLASKSLRTGPLSPLLRLVRSVEPWFRHVLRPRILAIGGTYRALCRYGVLDGYDGLEALPSGREGGLVSLAARLVEPVPERAVDWVIYLMDPADRTTLYPESQAVKRECIVNNKPFLATEAAALEWCVTNWLAADHRDPHPVAARFLRPRAQHDCAFPSGIALIAHDALKGEMLQFAADHTALLARFPRRLATGTTGGLLNGAMPARLRQQGDALQRETDAYTRLGFVPDDLAPRLREHERLQTLTTELRARLDTLGATLPWVDARRSGPQGGDGQIAQLVLEGACRHVIFFEDPHVSRQHEADIQLQAVSTARHRFSLPLLHVIIQFITWSVRARIRATMTVPTATATQIVRTDHHPAKPPTVMERLADIPEEEIWLAKQKSARTRRAYRLDVRHFMATLAITSHVELRQVDHRAVIAWERIMRETQRAAPSTIRRRLPALSSLFKHLVRHGHAAKNPVTEIERPAINRDEGTTLAFAKTQARKLLDTPADDPLDGLRDRAILSVGLQVGLRRAEIAALKVGDLHQNRGFDSLRVIRKGGRRDALAINPQTAARLRTYVERAGHADDMEGPLFRPLRHNGKQSLVRRPMHPDAIDRVVRKYAGTIALPRGYSAHSMRTTFITTALENGAQLEDVQKAAGHRDPSTTKLYDRRGYNPEKAASFFATY